MINRIVTVFLKELTFLRRDRMMFGMVVMIPIIQLLLFGYAINTNIRNIPVGLVDASHSSLSRALVQQVQSTQVVNFTETYLNSARAEQDLKNGKIRAYLIIPADINKRWAQQVASKYSGMTLQQSLAQWVVDGSEVAVAGALKGLMSMPFDHRLKPTGDVNTPVHTFTVTLLYNPEQRTAVNIVPGLIAIILTMTMTMFTSAAIVREKELGNLELLITTPITPGELMLGKVLPYVFVGALQASLILGLGHVLFDIPIAGSLWQFFCVTLLFIFATLSFGLVISTIAQNQLQSMQMTIFILLPSILLSGFMFPFEGMPKAIQYIAELFPATHYIRLTRSFILRDASFVGVYTDVLYLIGFTAVGLALASFRFKKRLD